MSIFTGWAEGGVRSNPTTLTLQFVIFLFWQAELKEVFEAITAELRAASKQRRESEEEIKLLRAEIA